MVLFSEDYYVMKELIQMKRNVCMSIIHVGHAHSEYDVTDRLL